jgi:hypothetical protein
MKKTLSSRVTDEEIDEDLTRLEEEGFPPQATADFAEGLVKYTPGPHAEETIRRVVDIFEGDALEELVVKHIVGLPIQGLDYCRPGRNTALVDDLKRRGIASSVTKGRWTVSWVGGETLEGESLCRIGLLAVWLKYMREKGGMDTSAY